MGDVTIAASCGVAATGSGTCALNADATACDVTPSTDAAEAAAATTCTFTAAVTGAGTTGGCGCSCAAGYSGDNCETADCAGMVPRGPGYATGCDGLATDGPACTQTCEDGYGDNNGGSGQTYSCPGGTFTGMLLTCTSDGPVWAACALCQPGHEPNANQTACAGCIAASFSPAGVRCLPCAPGRKR